MKYDTRLKKRIHLVKRVMMGQSLVNIAEDIGVSVMTLKRYISDVKLQAHWIGVYAGIKTSILSATAIDLRNNRKHYQALINYFDDQSAAFEKNPTPDYPFIYLDLPNGAQRSIETFMGTQLGRTHVSTIRQVVDAFNKEGLKVNCNGLGVQSMIKLFEALRKNKLESLWTQERLGEIEQFIARYKTKDV